MALWIPGPWDDDAPKKSVQCPVKAPEKEPVCPMPEPTPKRARRSTKKA